MVVCLLLLFVVVGGGGGVGVGVGGGGALDDSFVDTTWFVMCVRLGCVRQLQVKALVLFFQMLQSRSERRINTVYKMVFFARVCVYMYVRICV